MLIYIYTHTHTHTHIYIYIYTHTHPSMEHRKLVWVFDSKQFPSALIYRCVCIYIYVYIYVCIYIYIYIYMTADEENVKYCLKLLSREWLHLSVSLTVAEWHSHGQSYNREYGTLHHLSHTVPCNRLSATDVSDSVMYIYFVLDYAVHFNTGDFYCGNLSTEEIVIHVSQEM